MMSFTDQNIRLVTMYSDDMHYKIKNIIKCKKQIFHGINRNLKKSLKYIKNKQNKNAKANKFYILLIFLKYKYFYYKHFIILSQIKYRWDFSDVRV